MKTEAHLFKSLADETRLRILAADGERGALRMRYHGVLGITPSKASRHLR